jgi:hypothetical protein
MAQFSSVYLLPLAWLVACAVQSESPDPNTFPDEPSSERGGQSGGTQTPTSGSGGGTAAPQGGSAAAPSTGKGGTANTSGGSGGSSSGGSAGTSPSVGGSVASGEELLFEDFEDGVADGWIAGKDDEGADLGSWTVASGVYQALEATSDPSWAVGGDLLWTDQLIETKVRFPAGSAIEDATVFLVARFQNFDSYYFMEFYGDGHLKIRVKAAGSTSDLGDYDYSEVPLAPDTWVSIALSVKGSEVKGYFNGAEVLTASDSSLPSGGVALAARDSAADFDDVKVSVP